MSKATESMTMQLALRHAKEEVEQARREVDVSLRALQEEVAEIVDWRQAYRRHTGEFLLVGFAVGFLLAR